MTRRSVVASLARVAASPSVSTLELTRLPTVGEAIGINMTDPVVAVGFLAKRDLESLGTAFLNHFPLKQDDIFESLLRDLGRVEASPGGGGAQE